MAERPYTMLSCCMSLDGYLGSASHGRLKLSNEADFDRVDGERAVSDAILVGAATIRCDNPRLLVRSARRQADRVSRGRSRSPVKVTLTASGDLDPTAAFFTAGEVEKLVYCGRGVVERTRDRLGGVATVLAADAADDVGGAGKASVAVDLRELAEDLHARGIRRLMVEGGGAVHTQMLTAGLADELQLVVAPFFVGDTCAPRFVGDGEFPWTVTRRANLAEVRQVDDVALLRYALSSRFGER